MTTKKFNTLFHYVYIICDYGAVLGSFIIAYVIRRTADVATSLDLVEVPVLNFAFRDFIRIAPWISLLWIGLFVSTRHYVRIEKRRFTQELYNIFQGASLGVLGLMVMGFFMGHQLFSRLITVYAWAISIPALLLSRTLVHAVQRSFWKKGIGTKKVLVCGLGRMGRQLLEGIRQHGWPGNQIVGVLDEKYHPKQGFMFFNKNKTGPIIEHDPHQAAGFPVLGRPADLVDILTQHTVDDVIIGLGEFSDQEALSIMQTCRDRGILFSFIPDILGFASSFKVHTTINGIPLLSSKKNRVKGPGALIKRGIDAAVALGSLIVLSPLLLLLALGVKLSSPGPVIFGQDRIGAGSKPFKIYKFRSMRHGSSGQGKNNWTVEDDTRRTRFGSFMRRTNLDELPQLWNILKGDMSLIGPRPEQPQFVEQLTKEVSRYQERHQIRPGLTGWAQVNGWRGNTSIPERVQYDLFYLENWSLLFDLKIILYTFFSFFHGRGAY